MFNIYRQVAPSVARRESRLAGVALTGALHLALILAWQMAGKPVLMPQAGSDEAMLWLALPVPMPAPMPARAEGAARTPATPALATGRQAPAAPVPVSDADARSAPGQAPAVAGQAPAAPSARSEPAPSESATPAVPATPAAADILASARRSAGEIDRALRKENRPLIVAPPDSAQIRMREGMERARALAPPRLWEAPKVEELVNNTGDGARRTRVISGRRTYCITERAPTTNIEMIEMHGKLRLTNCPSHEEPPKRQAWRTARD